MKVLKFPLTALSLLSLCLSFPLYSSLALAKDLSPSSQHQVIIENAFIPEVGFDDNDNVQVVLDGKLPDICYELGETVVKKDPERKGFIISQFARKRPVLGCDKPTEDEGKENYLNFPVQYQKEVFLGRLEEGHYSIHFKNGTTTIGKRLFKVERTQVRNNIDELLYAPVTSAFIPEMIYETKNGEAVLTGILSSTCLTLNPEKIRVERHQDVVVVLPELMVDQLSTCIHSPRPINEIVPLGELRPGRYLLHVRSMTGVSLNKVFTVIKNREIERDR